MQPLISVILPVYNAEKYLSEAIESILIQTLDDFELIIINDGSTDESLNIINSFIEKDKRIKLITRENKGLVASLNEGIALSNGKFIARMDADDICLPTRFQEQINYMCHFDIDLCGSWIEQFNSVSNHTEIKKYPSRHQDILIMSIFECAFAHPSTMIRKQVFNSLSYRNVTAEDYKLWCEIILGGYRVANIPKVLLKYRDHDSQVTKSNQKRLKDSAREISRNFAFNLGILEKDVVTYKELFIKNNQSKTFVTLSQKVNKLCKKYEASIETKNNILLWLYQHSNSKTPLLYYYYFKSTLDQKKQIDTELILLLKSFLYIDKDSNTYNLLKRLYFKFLNR